MNPPNQLFEFEPIAYINSCFTQKFTTPRQPGLVKQAAAVLCLLPQYSHPDIVRGLAQYSHIWVIFVFHKSQKTPDKNTVRPPRLGGNEKRGVFATRSNFRPNPIGQSVVELKKIDINKGKIELHLAGVDILDGTPVLDIKPYIPYADALPHAEAGMASTPPLKPFTVEFSKKATLQLNLAKRLCGENFAALIVETLSYDVRPAYYGDKKQKSTFYSRLYDYELQWNVENGRVLVMNLQPMESEI